MDAPSLGSATWQPSGERLAMVCGPSGAPASTHLVIVDVQSGAAASTATPVGAILPREPLPE